MITNDELRRECLAGAWNDGKLWMMDHLATGIHVESADYDQALAMVRDLIVERYRDPATEALDAT